VADLVNPAERASLTEALFSFAVFAVVSCGLYASSLYSYLLFHSLVELFCMFVMLSAFLLSWNSRKLLDNHYFLFLALSFIPSGALELLHTFSYKGLGIFPGQGANLPTQSWIAFRYVFSLSFLAAPFFVTRRLNVNLTLGAFAAVTPLLIAAVFSGLFPDCFIEGSGLTPFKIYSEYVIIGLLMTAMALLYRKRDSFDSRVFRGLMFSIVSAIAADAAFTRYISVYGQANLVGHLLLFLSAFLIYRAVVVTGIKQPAVLLFRDLELSQRALQESEELLQTALAQRTGELREKEVLLKEIHHRVKNNLQVISSLVSLQADGSQDETVRDGLLDVIYRVRSMALVHEKLYRSDDLARVDFAGYAESLLSYLWQAHGVAAANIRLNLELDPLQLPVDTAVPCGLILNELAGNALKHAFRQRDGGEVTVSLYAKEREVRLGVRDDGVGMPPDLDWRQSTSLGLRLVQMLAGQLKAEVTVTRSSGTGFEITFQTAAT
jgi:two-component sensor histidine kinase